LLEDVDSFELLFLDSFNFVGLLLVESIEEGKESNTGNSSDSSVVGGESSLLSLLVLCCK
jgi:hypothetical protein